MASTLVALQTVTVGAGGVSSVTFSSIPQTYNDLVIKSSSRTTGTNCTYFVNFNGTNTGTTALRLYAANGVGGASGSFANSYFDYGNPSNSTANTFSNSELYIPNYASSNNKSVSSETVTEDNSTTWQVFMTAGVKNNTNPITSITISPVIDPLIAQYSTFTLYGVYNSASESAPSVPTIGTATDAGTGGAVSVPFTAGANTGAVYTAISTPGSITASNNYSPIPLSGLTNGTAYTFQVKAANPGGESAYSSASNSVTPTLANSYESIATATASGSLNSITFSSIPGTYTHLQLRGISGTTSSSTDVGYIQLLLNSDSGTNYSRHQLYGTTSVIYSYGAADNPQYVFGSSYRFATASSIASPAIIDVLDYANTNKYKTLRSLSGTSSNTTGTSMVGMFSTVWRSTSAITSITIKVDSGITLQNGTTFALYGIKG
jgi:hypothetical protein